MELWESNTKGGEEKVLANIEFLDRTRDIAGVASRLWWVENLISKITKLWRARENMTERVKSWRNLTIPPNTKTNIHIHHSIFSSFYSTSLLLALTNYLPWIRRVGEARFHQFPLPGRSGILWIAICTRIVLLSRFFEWRNPRNRGRIKYNLETGAPLSLFAVLESIAGGTGHIY